MNRLYAFFATSRFVGPTILAALIGVGTSLGAILFIRWIDICSTFFFGSVLSTLKALAPSIGTFMVVFVPALGAIIVGLLVVYGVPEAKGHGVPEVMKAIALKGGRIRPIVVVGKALASGVALGSGASAGREGPIVQIGSALGSTVGRLFRARESGLKNYIGCGAAAGIAAVFNAPIAGVMFALEVILRDFNTRALNTVVVAAVTASIVSRIFLGESPSFHIPLYRLENPMEIFLYILLGILAAWTALLFVEVLHRTEITFDSWKVHPLVKPVTGGLILGVLCFWMPQLFGTGFGAIEDALRGDTVFGILAILVVLKIVATSVTLGSGSSGGVFAPALFIGAVLGGAFGKLVEMWFPFAAAPAGAYALVGMSSVFAAAAHAPITAILIVFEMTGDYRMILPLMLGTVIATAISQMVRSESIYTLKLKRGGIDFATLDEARLMDAILVDESKTKDFVAVSRRLPLDELMDKMGRNKEKSFYTVDDDGYLFGQVNLTDIEEALFEREGHLILADDISTPPATCFPNENLNDALRTMLSRHVTHLAVVDPTDPRRIVGALRREDILRSYTKIASHRADQLSKMDQVRDGLGTIEVRFRVSRRSRLIGKAIKDLSLPEGAVFTSVRRGRDTIIPRGQTVLKGGDLITALVSPKIESQFGGWRTENKV